MGFSEGQVKDLKKFMWGTTPVTGDVFYEEKVDWFAQNYDNRNSLQAEEAEKFREIREVIKRGMTVCTDVPPELALIMMDEIGEVVQEEQQLRENANLKSASKFQNDYKTHNKLIEDSKNKLADIEKKRKLYEERNIKRRTLGWIDSEFRNLTSREKNDQKADAEVIFSRLTKEQQESAECIDLKNRNDVIGLALKLKFELAQGINLEALIDSQEFGLDDEEKTEYMTVIGNRLEKANPLSRLMMNNLTSNGTLAFEQTEDGAYYNNEEKKVVVNYRKDLQNVTGAGETLFHELSHAIDYQGSGLNIVGETGHTVGELRMYEKALDEYVSDQKINDCQQKIREIESKPANQLDSYEEMDLVHTREELDNIQQTKSLWESHKSVRSIMKYEDWSHAMIEIAKTCIDGRIFEDAIHNVGIISSNYTHKNLYHNALKRDYETYINGFIKPAYFPEMIDEKERAVEIEMAVRKLIENRILRRAKYLSDNNMDMSKYGGSMLSAMSLATNMVVKVTSMSLEEQSRWLRENDIFAQPDTKASLATTGPQDIISGFAKIELQNKDLSGDRRKILEHITKTMQWGHSSQYWNKGELSVTRINTEAFAEMNEAEMGGPTDQSLFYMEFLPDGFSYFKRMRRDCIRRM